MYLFFNYFYFSFSNLVIQGKLKENEKFTLQPVEVFKYFVLSNELYLFMYLNLHICPAEER